MRTARRETESPPSCFSLNTAPRCAPPAADEEIPHVPPRPVPPAADAQIPHVLPRPVPQAADAQMPPAQLRRVPPAADVQMPLAQLRRVPPAADAQMPPAQLRRVPPAAAADAVKPPVPRKHAAAAAETPVTAAPTDAYPPRALPWRMCRCSSGETSWTARTLLQTARCSASWFCRSTPPPAITKDVKGGAAYDRRQNKKCAYKQNKRSRTLRTRGSIVSGHPSDGQRCP